MPELGTGQGGSRPLLTYYDDESGERTELSAATLDNWVAKTANLLVDGHGLGPGDTAAVHLPPHWQTAAVLLGCWAAGLTVTPGKGADIAFVTPDRAGEVDAGDVYTLDEYATEVRAHGDRFPGGRDRPDATERAAALGIAPGDRVLIDADEHPDPADWLLAPLSAGASIVLCRHLDPTKLAARLAAEKITRVLGS